MTEGNNYCIDSRTSAIGKQIRGTETSEESHYYAFFWPVQLYMMMKTLNVTWYRERGWERIVDIAAEKAIGALHSRRNFLLIYRFSACFSLDLIMIHPYEG